jgi:hypothetical protein
MSAGTLEVFLIGAVGIKDNVIGKADPYAVLLCGKQKLRSNTASGQGSKPIWNQKFSFYIDDKTFELSIKVFNHRLIAEDEELGSTTIPLARVFADGKLPTTSYNVIRPSGRVQGEVKLSITFTAKQRPGQHNLHEFPGPYNEKIHGSPYAAPPEPTVKHDPLTGPYGYFKNNSSTSPSAHGSKPNYFSSDSNLEGNRPYPSSEVNAYPPSVYPPVPSTNAPYHHIESGPSYQHSGSGSSSSEDGSSHGRLYPVTPSTSTDYNGGIYVQSPYGGPRPAPPPHLSTTSHLGSISMPSAPTAYPPPYASGSSHGGLTPYRFDDLAGNFGSLNISGGGIDSSSQGMHHGYHSAPSFPDNRPPAGYPPLESVSGHSVYDYPSNDRPPSGYPPAGYPTPGYPPQYGSSQGEFQRQGSYSLYGYQNPPSSFYPQELGVPQQPYARTDDLPPPSSYPPAPYYDASKANYVPAGYPR